MASTFFKTDDYIYKPEGSFSGDFGSSNYKYSSKDEGSGNKWKDAFNLAGKYLQNSSYGDVNRYREAAKTSFGDSKSGGAFSLSDGLNVVYPQQQAPLYVPGVEGKRGLGGTIGGLVGTIGGALIGGPAGAALGGSIGSGVGGLF
jgi:hypothetical protein